MQPALSRQRGVGLVEILVAVLILGIGVLGFAGMQLKALKSTDVAFYRAQATVLASDIASRMTVNPGQDESYIKGWAKVGTGASPSWWKDCIGSNKSCTPKQLAQWDVKQSAWQVAHLLPNGSIKVSGCDALCQITIAWNKTTVRDCDASSNDCVVMEVVP